MKAISDKINTIWNIIKCEPGKLYLTEQIIADAFSAFFWQSAENLSLHQEESGDVISFLKKKAFPRKFPGIKTIPTTETDKKYNTFSQSKKLFRL
jgi:hypothetical protein